MKTMFFRLSLVIFYFFLLGVLFYSGRTHTILIDNKDSDTIAAFGNVTISVNKEPSTTLRKNERDKFIVKGQSVQIIVIPQGSEKKVFKVHIPIIDDTVLISIPKLVAGTIPYLEPFDMYAQTN